MKRNLLLALITGGILIASSCKKTETPTDKEVPFNELEQTVVNDFTNKIALPGYKDLQDKSDALYTALNNLNTSATDANLATAQAAWKDMRTTWEQCEGFLFGPVEDNDYDPNMDTWPTDYHQMDSLMTSSANLSDVSAFTLSLRGYHPIEYIIFGVHGERTAASLTARQKAYMVSLATDVKGTCHDLYASWAGTGNFADKVTTAGAGSDKYATKKELFLAIVGAMAGICDEVGGGKMKEPYDAIDSSIVESPYSNNSTIDFKNNIIGLRNVYMGKDGGKGLSAMVAVKNKEMDNTIQAHINAAINSFDQITLPYGQAIQNTNGQRTQIQQTMTALETLKGDLEGSLTTFVQQYVQD